MSIKNTKVINGDLVVIGNIFSQNSFQDLELVQVGNVLQSIETFEGKHLRVLVEYETDGVHYGFGVDLHPYNNAICLSFYIVGGEILTGYVDEEGHIVLSLPSGLTLTEIQAHYFIHN